MASPAARLMMMKEFPTPPFWLAMATITGRSDSTTRRCALHLVFAQIVRVEALEPLVQPIRVRLVGGDVERLGVVDDRLFHEDGCPRAQREGDGVARTGVDGERVAVEEQIDQRVERVLLQVADDD